MLGRFSAFYLLFLLCYYTGVAAYPKWIDHDMGKEYLSDRPLRVVALNWTQAEMLLTLGITPVGVASIEGYQRWQSNSPPLPKGVVDVGHRGTPNLQAITALQPDLIVGYRFRHAKLYTQLHSIAPTLIFDQYPSKQDPRNYFERMQSIFMTLAIAIDKPHEARQALNLMHSTISTQRKRILSTGLAHQKTLFGKFVGMGMGIRIYSDKSLPGALINKLGLSNALDNGLVGRDFTHLQLAQLAKQQSVNLLYSGDLHREGQAMMNSPIWPMLSFVKQKTLYSVPQLWSFGGPVSAQRMAKAFTTALVEP